MSGLISNALFNLAGVADEARAANKDFGNPDANVVETLTVDGSNISVKVTIGGNPIRESSLAIGGEVSGQGIDGRPAKVRACCVCLFVWLFPICVFWFIRNCPLILKCALGTGNVICLKTKFRNKNVSTKNVMRDLDPSSLTGSNKRKKGTGIHLMPANQPLKIKVIITVTVFCHKRVWTGIWEGMSK